MNILEEANQVVVKTEVKYLNDLSSHVEKMKQRAEKSNTTIAWNEYHSAYEYYLQELARLRLNQ